MYIYIRINILMCHAAMYYVAIIVMGNNHGYLTDQFKCSCGIEYQNHIKTIKHLHNIYTLNIHSHQNHKASTYSHNYNNLSKVN